MNLMKRINFFLVKKLIIKKTKIYFENCALYGLYSEPEPNCYLSKVGTGTVKNSYGFAALEKTVLWIRNYPDPNIAVMPDLSLKLGLVKKQVCSKT
jgi:hypothetical protein